MGEADFKHQIVSASRLLHNIGLVSGASGNISIRSVKRIFITPSGVHKGMLTPEDISVINPEGVHISGPAPTTELLLHMEIYKRDESARAIVHAHPPWTLAMDMAGRQIDASLLAEAALFLKNIPVVKYYPPGTAELAEAVGKEIDKGPVQILSRHGAVSRGESLVKALEYIEYLEQSAKVQVLGNLLGQIG